MELFFYPSETKMGPRAVSYLAINEWVMHIFGLNVALKCSHTQFTDIFRASSVEEADMFKPLCTDESHMA